MILIITNNFVSSSSITPDLSNQPLVLFSIDITSFPASIKVSDIKAGYGESISTITIISTSSTDKIYILISA